MSAETLTTHCRVPVGANTRLKPRCSMLFSFTDRLWREKCGKCGRSITHFHGYDHAIRLRHLPIFEQPVYVEFRPKRYQCKDCKGKPTTTQRLSWHKLRSPNTKAYERWLLKFLVNESGGRCSPKAQYQ